MSGYVNNFVHIYMHISESIHSDMIFGSFITIANLPDTVWQIRLVALL